LSGYILEGIVIFSFIYKKIFKFQTNNKKKELARAQPGGELGRENGMPRVERVLWCVSTKSVLMQKEVNATFSKEVPRLSSRFRFSWRFIFGL
jgi:hypothetical protein